MSPRASAGGSLPRPAHRSITFQTQAAPDGADTAHEAAPLMVASPSGSGPTTPDPSDPGRPGRPSDPPIDWVATGLCFAFPALGGAMFGLDIGATSGVLPSLTSAALSGTDWHALSPFQSGLVVSTSLAGALAASLTALAAGNAVGRRSELLAAAALYGAGAALEGGAWSLESLLAGRAIYGLGMGLAMHAAPAYIAETAPPSVRGLLISLKEAAIVAGILAGYWGGFVFVSDVGGWRSMYGVALPAALLLGAGMASLPESPRWLLLSGAGRREAGAALARAEGRRATDPAVLDAELTAMEVGLAAGGSSGGSVAQLVGEQRYLRPLLVGMSLMLFQQITGQPSVLYYAAQIFERAGFGAGQEAAGVSVLLGVFKLVMTLVAVTTVDRWGRRPLLLAGVSGMVVALAALGASTPGGAGALLSATSAGDAPLGAAAAWTSAAALLLYVGCYQMSFGPISWLIVGEVFPLAVRSQAIAIATFVNFSSNFAVSLLLPTLQDTFGMRSTYWLFAAVGVLAVLSINATVPETKGKTLEEIEAMWGSAAAPAKQQERA